MPEYLSGKKRIQNIGINSYSENTDSLNVVGNILVSSGRVGIGSTIPTEDLDLSTIRVRDTLYDSNNFGGVLGYFLTKDIEGIKWVSVPPINSNSIFITQDNSIIGVSSFIGINFISDQYIDVSSNSINSNFADVRIVPNWLRSGNNGIYTTKNVGIGTTIPTADFQVGFGTTGVTIDGSSGIVSAIGYYGNYSNFNELISGISTVSKFLNVVGLGSTSLSVYLASSGGITSTGGDLYVGGKLFAGKIEISDLNVQNINSSGISTFNIVKINNGNSNNFIVSGLTSTKDLLVSGISSFSDIFSSGVITASNFVGDLTGNADTATYAINSGVSTYSLLAGVSTYSSVSGVSTVSQGLTGIPNIVVGLVTAFEYYGVFKGTIDSNVFIGYAATAGIATYANVAGVSTYASNAGIATYANVAGVSTYASNAGVATYANLAGVSTYASNAGIATYASNAGVATYANVAGVSTYASNAGIATYASNAGIATYASNAGIATYASNAGVATYANVAGVSTYASNAGVATYANVAGVATYASNAGIATYANVAGVATYANVAGVSTYASNAGVATYANVAGVSTNIAGGNLGNIPYQLDSNITNFVPNGTSGQVLLFDGSKPIWSNVSSATGSFGGITVYDEGNIVGTSGSITTLNIVSPNLKVIATTGANGIATISMNDNIVGSALSISGITTFQGNVSVGDSIFLYPLTGIISAASGGFIGNLIGTASTSSFATTAFNLNGVFEEDLKVAYASTSGISTYANYAGVSTYSHLSGVSTSVVGGIASVTSLNVSGLSTISELVVNDDLNVYASDTTFHQNVVIQGNLTVNGTEVIINADEKYIKDKQIILGFSTTNSVDDITSNGGGFGIASTEGNPLLSLYAVGVNTLPSTYKQFIWTKSNTYGIGTTDAFLSNYAIGIGSTLVPNGVRLAVGGVHITDTTVNGIFSGNGSYLTDLNASNISVGTLDNGRLPQNINVSGIITALEYYGTFKGVIDSTVTLEYSNRSGVATYANVAGVSTYASNAGVATYANVAGVSTYASNAGIATYASNAGVATYANVAGVSTYASNAGVATYANVSGVSTYASNAGVATYANLAGVSTNVIGGIASVTSLSVSGISTLGNVQISPGIITATSGIVTYYGDGSKLTNIISGVGIQSVGQTIGTGFTTLNFIGTGNTFSVNGSTVNISINSAVDSIFSGYASTAGVSTSVIGGIASVTSLSVSGVSTLGNVQISSGIITATSGIVTYYGDGSKLENIISVAGIGIGSDGVFVGSGITYVDFAGPGVSSVVYSPSGIATITISSSQREVTTFISTEGQTTFNLEYEPGFVDVYLNGSKLTNSEYTANNGSSIVLSNGASANDVIETISFNYLGLFTKTTAEYAIVSGISSLSTLSQGLTGTPNLTVGIVTATKYYGDGSSLTGISNGGGSIQVLNYGATVGTSITAINFNGVGVSTIATSTGISTITITGSQRTVSSFTATEGQTTFYCQYNPSVVDVYINGSRLNSVEYISIDGSTIILSSPSSINDNIEVVSFTSVGSFSELTSQYSETSGISTSSLNLVGTPNIIVGVATATKYYGDGSSLSNVTGQVSVLNQGTFVGSGITSINFVGSGVSSIISSSGIATISFVGSQRNTASFVATNGQTIFTTSYTVGYVDVYKDGIRLSSSQYTAIDGETIVLSSGATAGEIIDIVSATNIVDNIIDSKDIRIQSVSEKISIVNGNIVNLIYNDGSGNVGVVTNPSNNITLNVNGIPVDSSFNNRQLKFSVIVTQSGVARSCTSVNLNGVSKTIMWSGGSLENAIIGGGSTSNGYDVYNFIGINTVGSANTTTNYIILGSVNGGFY